MLRFMGSQRVGHELVTELNYTHTLTHIYKPSKHPHIFSFVTQSGIKIRITLDFSLEISDTKFFKTSLQNPEEKCFETKLLSPAKIIFKREAKYRYIWTYKNSYDYLLMELL